MALKKQVESLLSLQQGGWQRDVEEERSDQKSEEGLNTNAGELVEDGCLA